MEPKLLEGKRGGRSERPLKKVVTKKEGGTCRCLQGRLLDLSGKGGRAP